MKKRKIRIERLIIVILAGMLLFSLLCFGAYHLISFIGNKMFPQSDPAIKDPEPIKTNETVKISLVDYETYIDDGSLGFSFVVANLLFEDEQPVSFDLGNLQTSEKIYLNNVAKYLNALLEKSYRISQLELSDSILSDQNSIQCKIFIPYTTESTTLRILNSVDKTMIEIPLDKNLKDISSLKFTTQQQIETDNSNFTVSSSSISTMMLHNGEEYQIPSTMNIYTFRIHVNEVKDNVMITDARFVRENSSEVIECMSEEYESVKVSNVLGKKLTEGENGALFFEASSRDGIDYSGSLMLMLSDSDEWIKIPTILE